MGVGVGGGGVVGDKTTEKGCMRKIKWVRRMKENQAVQF